MKFILSLLFTMLLAAGAHAQGFTPITANGVQGIVAKAAPGTMYGFTVKPSADGLLQILDATSIPANGSIGVPVKCYSVTANVSVGIEWTTIPVWFPNGIVLVLSTGTDCTQKAGAMTGYFSVNEL